MKRAAWLGSVLFLVLAGCVSMGYRPPAPAPLASAESDAQAKQFAPPAGKGYLYVAGPNEILVFGNPTAYAITIDGAQVGGLVSGMYFCVPLEPGQHTLSASGEFSIAHARVAVEAGKNYFYQLNREKVSGNTEKLNLGWVPIEALGKRMIEGNKRGKTSID